MMEKKHDIGKGENEKLSGENIYALKCQRYLTMESGKKLDRQCMKEGGGPEMPVIRDDIECPTV